MTVIRHVDSSGMLYSYAGSLDSFLDLRLYYVQLEVLSRFLEISLSLSLSLSLSDCLSLKTNYATLFFNALILSLRSALLVV